MFRSSAVFATYLIGLREGLEAGLIVGILIAYVRKLGRADLLPRLWVGIGVAVAVSLGLGALLTFGPYGLSFQAQELLGGGLSLVAVGLVTWMIFWMSQHARGLKGELQHRVDTALLGTGAGIVTLGVVSVGREGIETALFVWATFANTAGALLGIATAVALSWLISRGFVRIDLGRFFTWTGAFLIVVAAGVLVYGIGDLQEAGALPGWGQSAYSVAAAIPPSSWYGVLLAGIFNFTAEPTWAQVIGWLGYVGIALTVFVLRVRPRRPSSPPVAASPSTADPAVAAGSTSAAAVSADARPA
jgi:high-affinity iron transporter